MPQRRSAASPPLAASWLLRPACLLLPRAPRLRKAACAPRP